MSTLTAPPPTEVEKRLTRELLILALLERRITVDQFDRANREMGLCKPDPRWDHAPVTELQELTS